MGDPVVVLVDGRVEKPVIGAEVHDLDRLRELTGQWAGRAVRKGQKDQVGIGQGVRRGLDEHGVGQAAQVRMDRSDPLPDLSVGGGGREFEVRMGADQTQQLAARVPTRPGHGHPISHVDNYASPWKQIQQQGAASTSSSTVTSSIREPATFGKLSAPPLRSAAMKAEADGTLIDTIRRDLRDAADPSLAPGMQAYMKSSMPYLGVRVPLMRSLTRAAERDRPPADLETLIATAAELWRQASHREERYAATALLDTRSARRLRDVHLLPLIEEMIRTGAWWDHVDEVSHRVGDLLRLDPVAMDPILRRWAADDDLWVRRSAIIAQLGHKVGTDLACSTSSLR